jgi:hypothetical protein
MGCLVSKAVFLCVIVVSIFFLSRAEKAWKKGGTQNNFVFDAKKNRFST